MFAKARELNGEVSGEHGIGFEKASYLKNALGINVYTLLKQIKKAEAALQSL